MVFIMSAKVEPPVVITSPQRPVFLNTKRYQVKPLFGTSCKRTALLSDRENFLELKFKIFVCFLPPVSVTTSQILFYYYFFFL